MRFHGNLGIQLPSSKVFRAPKASKTARQEVVEVGFVGDLLLCVQVFGISLQKADL